ncbi:hypothetical protein [Enterococcus phage vB_Efs10_KEN05]
MDFKEFKEEIEKVAYLTTKEGNLREVYVKSSLGLVDSAVPNTIACIDSAGVVDFGWHGSIKATHMKKVIKLVEEFAKTPFDERFPKNYRLLIGENYVSGITFTHSLLSADCKPEEPIEVTFNGDCPHLFNRKNKEQASKMLDAAKIKHTWEVV